MLSLAVRNIATMLTRDSFFYNYSYFTFHRVNVWELHPSLMHIPNKESNWVIQSCVKPNTSHGMVLNLMLLSRQGSPHRHS